MNRPRTFVVLLGALLLVVLAWPVAAQLAAGLGGFTIVPDAGYQVEVNGTSQPSAHIAIVPIPSATATATPEPPTSTATAPPASASPVPASPTATQVLPTSTPPLPTATPQGVLNLAGYCDAAGECRIGQWLRDAAARRLVAYAPNGTYRYPYNITMVSDVTIRCESHAAVFQSTTASHGFYAQPDQRITNVLVEGCGFDYNGNAKKFAAFLKFGGANITVRNNRMFDSTMLGLKPVEQREAISLIGVTNVVVEDNVLSEGSRIKVGRPGEHVIIRRNHIEQANDNAIAIVGFGANVSRDFLVENNTIFSPESTGVFLGADGWDESNPLQAVYDMVVRNNTISGAWWGACIKANLPSTAERITIEGNTCTKLPNHATLCPQVTCDSDPFTKGVFILTTPTHTLRTGIVVRGNTVEAADRSLEHGALYVGGPIDQITIADNTLITRGQTVWLRGSLAGTIAANAVTGTVRNDSTLTLPSDGFVPVAQGILQ